MLYKLRRIFGIKRQGHNINGAAIAETAVGLFVLLPVFFLLIDVIALVTGQTINDDIAKNAARAAGACKTLPLAQIAVGNYFTNYCKYTGASGLLVSQASLYQDTINWNSTATPPTVSLSTSVVINLPIPVPLGGPSTQVMTSQYSAPILGISQ